MPPQKMRFCPHCASPLTLREDHEQRPRRFCQADCGFVFYDNPTPVVAALVQLDQHAILIQNKGWPDHWFGLVSGFLERDEDPAEGALRELSEELGLRGDAPSLIGVYPFPMMNQVIIAYHIVAHGEVAMGDELAAFKPVPIDRLRPWPGATGDAVRDWLARSS